MKSDIVRQVETQLFTITAKISSIQSKYELLDDMDVKDIEDMRRYSEIARNLSGYLVNLYRY